MCFFCFTQLKRTKSKLQTYAVACSRTLGPLRSIYATCAASLQTCGASLLTCGAALLAVFLFSRMIGAFFQLQFW